MSKSKPTASASPATPRVAEIGTTPAIICDNLRIVDAKTKEPIERVIFADVDAGVVRRYAVEDGNLVRDGDEFKVIDEEREIRIEWIEPPVDDAVNAVSEADA